MKGSGITVALVAVMLATPVGAFAEGQLPGAGGGDAIRASVQAQQRGLRCRRLQRAAQTAISTDSYSSARFASHRALRAPRRAVKTVLGYSVKRSSVGLGCFRCIARQIKRHVPVSEQLACGTHDLCATGASLSRSLGSCVRQVCAREPDCCRRGWDASCVAAVRSLCNESCETCTHDVCEAGGALEPTCSACAERMAAVDPFCNDTAWSDDCSAKVEAVCGESCAATVGTPVNPQSCLVTFRVNNATNANALELEIDHNGAPAGRFPKGGGCSGFPSFNASTSANDTSLHMAWADNVTTLVGPDDFATCTFIATAPPATLTPADFGVTVLDCSVGTFNPAVCSPAPEITVTVGACTDVTPVCGNAVVEGSEECDDGNTVDDETCSSTCEAVGSTTTTVPATTTTVAAPTTTVPATTTTVPAPTTTLGGGTTSTAPPATTTTTLAGVTTTTPAGSTTTLPACEGNIIDFEDAPAGTPVSVVNTSQGQPVVVKGTNPKLGAGVNAALLYDSSCATGTCTGRDSDLGTPNEDFGGPGIGDGGASGSPTQNDEPLHNLLIVATNLTDADIDGLVDAPNDQKGTLVTQEFDFAAFAPVSVLGLRLVDVGDTEGAATVELFDSAGHSIVLATAPNAENNGLVKLDLPPNEGVWKMIITLHGSGGIDRIRLNCPSGSSTTLPPTTTTIAPATTTTVPVTTTVPPTTTTVAPATTTTVPAPTTTVPVTTTVPPATTTTEPTPTTTVPVTTTTVPVTTTTVPATTTTEPAPTTTVAPTTTTIPVTTTSTSTSTTVPESFAFVCKVKIGVTSTETFGSLKYQIDYTNAPGEFDGSGLTVTCTNLSGASSSFFDDEVAHTIAQSTISLGGFTSPLDLCECDFNTNDSSVGAGDFALTVLDAFDPTLTTPLNPTIVVKSVDCASNFVAETQATRRGSGGLSTASTGSSRPHAVP